MNESRISRFGFPLFIIGTYLFLYIPIFVLFYTSFNLRPDSLTWGGFTTQWYVDLFSSPEMWAALLNSLIVSTLAAFFSLVLGVMLVVGCGHQNLNLVNLFYAPVLIPEIIVAVAMLSFFAWFAAPLGLATLVLGHTVLGLGFVVPLVHARFMELDERLVEASLDLGATKWQTYRYIILPLLKPAIISAGLLAFIISFDDFLISFFCAGPTSQTLSLYIFSTIRAGINPEINALSVLLLVTAGILVIFFARPKSEKEGAA